MQQSKKIILQYIDEKWFMHNFHEKDNWYYAVVKRVGDLFFGLIGIVLFCILYPILGIVIKLESEGPILYKQERVGKNGKVIVIRKFRTMHECVGEKCVHWREKDKNSVTKVGKLLRMLHFDEIPQAINLLVGDMSFIGPRAEWIEFARLFEKEIPFYKKRYLVNPGLMGWAQINYPASQSVEQAKEKFEYDLYYIKNRSILLDAEIILKSAKLYFHKK